MRFHLFQRNVAVAEVSALVGSLWDWDSFCMKLHRFGRVRSFTRQAHYASFLVGAHRSHNVIRERFISTANSLILGF